MNQILRNLLKPQEPPRQFCTVSERLGDGRYRVRDDQGRIFTVDGNSGYLPGNEVEVQNGRIQRVAHRDGTVKKVRV